MSTAHSTFRNFYAVTEEDNGSVTLEIQNSNESGGYALCNMTMEEAEALAFDITSAVRRQRAKS